MNKPLGEALKDSLQESARLYITGKMPLVGRKAIVASGLDGMSFVTGEPLDGGMARSGDFGYVYGRYEIKGGNVSEKESTSTSGCPSISKSASMTLWYNLDSDKAFQGPQIEHYLGIDKGIEPMKDFCQNAFPSWLPEPAYASYRDELLDVVKRIFQ